MMGSLTLVSSRSVLAAQPLRRVRRDVAESTNSIVRRMEIVFFSMRNGSSYCLEMR